MTHQIEVKLLEPVEDVAKAMVAQIVPLIRAAQHHVLEAANAKLLAAAMDDHKKPARGQCRHCGTKLHSEASLARGECAGCFADRKQIGPDRPKG